MRHTQCRLLNCWRARWRTAASRKLSGRLKTLISNVQLSSSPDGSFIDLCRSSLIHPLRSWQEAEASRISRSGILWAAMACSASQTTGDAADWPTRTFSRSSTKLRAISICRERVWASRWTNDISGDGLLLPTVICVGVSLSSSVTMSPTSDLAACHEVSSELDRWLACPLIKSRLVRTFLKQEH